MEEQNMTDKIPFRQFRFRVEIDGIGQAGFNECTFADSSTEATEYRNGDEPPIFRKLSGLTKYGNITLKWGITDSMALYDWRQQVIDKGANGARKKMAIILIDEAGADATRWEIVEAWPVKYKPIDMSAKSNDVAIETLEVAHEGFKRTK
jgi:phage tail-like protein